jgi:hypothetical protein
MSHIIQTLRQAAQDGREIIEPWQMDPNLYDEAANEIERCHAEIQLLKSASSARSSLPSGESDPSVTLGLGGADT